MLRLPVNGLNLLQVINEALLCNNMRRFKYRKFFLEIERFQTRRHEGTETRRHEDTKARRHKGALFVETQCIASLLCSCVSSCLRAFVSWCLGVCRVPLWITLA